LGCPRDRGVAHARRQDQRVGERGVGRKGGRQGVVLSLSVQAKKKPHGLVLLETQKAACQTPTCGLWGQRKKKKNKNCGRKDMFAEGKGPESTKQPTNLMS